MAYGIYTDVYALVETRSADLVRRFLNHFLPQRGEASDEHEFPQFAQDPDFVFVEIDNVLSYCESETTVTYGLYWSSTSGGEPKDAMVFYTEDGCTILGLTLEDFDLEAHYLRELQQFSNSPLSGISHAEAPPPLSREAFRSFLVID